MTKLVCLVSLKSVRQQISHGITHDMMLQCSWEMPHTHIPAFTILSTPFPQHLAAVQQDAFMHVSTMLKCSAFLLLPCLAFPAIVPRAARLVTHRALVPGIAHTFPADAVAVPVEEVAVAVAVTAGPPPAPVALALTRVLVARRDVAVAAQAALLSPEAPLAGAVSRHRVTPGGALEKALARPGAGWRPPALLAGAVAVDRVAAGVAAARALVLAQRAPAAGQAGALTRGWVAGPVGVAEAELTAVRGPKLRRAACNKAAVEAIGRVL